jgi:hypothetical protein
LTPWKSGALSFSPGAPGSTTYQTWMTGTPFARQAAARPLTFSTTFCSFACCGAPESAHTPPSIITSFCRSWTSSAQRAGSSLSSSFTFASLLYLMYGSRRGPTSVRIA